MVASQIRSITIYQTIGHIVNNSRPQHLQGLIENQGRRNAVSIVVTVNQDEFLVLDGCLDSFHCTVHVIEQEGIVEGLRHLIGRVLDLFQGLQTAGQT